MRIGTSPLNPLTTRTSSGRVATHDQAIEHAHSTGRRVVLGLEHHRVRPSSGGSTAPAATGVIRNRPWSAVPSSAAKHAPLSKRGTHHQSIEPSRDTSAAVLAVAEQRVVLEPRRTVDHSAKLPGLASRAMATTGTRTSTGMPAHTRSLIGVDVGGSGIKAAHVDLATGTGERTDPGRDAEARDARRGRGDGRQRWSSQLGDDRARSAARCPRSSSDGTVRTAAHIDQSWIGTHAAAVIGRGDRPARAPC